MTDNYLQGTLNTAIQTVDASKLDKLRQNLGEAKNSKDIEHTAQEFEAIFIAQMLQSMFEGIKTDAVFGGGQSEEIYRSMNLQEYAKVISESGGVGLADDVMKEMLKLQEIGGKNES